MAQKTFNNTKINVNFEETSSRQQINSGENISTLFGKIKKFFSDLKSVAFSGSYKDLSDTPTIPSVGNGTITITQNGVEKGTFSVNQSGNKTIELSDEIASNPNLLINPDFAINQRGDITYDGTISYLTYFVDRWMRLGGVSKVDNGVSICKGNSPYGIGILAQKIENGTAYSGKTATLSAKVDGEVVTLSGVISETVVSKSGTVSMDLVLGSDGAILLQIYTSDTTAHIIEWAKFEISDFATDYQSPNGETELLKCQHYYQIRSSGDIAAVDMRPSMRNITDIKQRGDGTYEYIAEL